MFGVAPVAGRLLNPDDAERSAVVSRAFAERNFGGSSAALGRSVFIENRSYEIVGVMPAPSCGFPPKTEVWAAAALDPRNRNRSGHNYLSVARLAPGVSLEAANAGSRPWPARSRAPSPIPTRASRSWWWRSATTW